MPAELWKCSNTQYHADNTKIGASMLKVVLESPVAYHGLYVADPPLHEKKQSKDLLLGSLVHCMVLEPQQMTALYIVRPNVDGRTTKGKEVLAKFALEAASRIEITQELKDQAAAMAGAILANPIAQDIMKDAAIEQAVTWEEDGLKFKCKPDLFCRRDDSTDVQVDIKTADDPYPHAWLSQSDWSPMFKWRYDMQVAAHYPIGIEAMTGRPCASGVIVVGKSWPHDVFVYDTTCYRNCGTAWRNKAIQIIRSCMESGQWTCDYGVIPGTEPQPWNYPQEV